MEYDIQSRLQEIPAIVTECLNGPDHEAAITAIIPGEPVAKSRPRLTRRGRAYTPQKTAVAEEYVRTVVISQTGCLSLEGPVALELLTVLPIPMSWSQKKRMAAQKGMIRPAVTPDFDNLSKLYCDAVNGIWWQDDRQMSAPI
ncbi:hypothetical protein GCM10023116_19510 [Kistimonas scapharcae]|uniref:Uncharacterized protein n=1 Tax=Kistimonas scapharcae TaxID=1036133 RepID=A0ABP8V2M0_9GAMM